MIPEFRRPSQKRFHGLHREFQVSIGYKGRACLKTHRAKDKQTNKQTEGIEGQGREEEKKWKQKGGGRGKDVLTTPLLGLSFWQLGSTPLRCENTGLLSGLSQGMDFPLCGRGGGRRGCNINKQTNTLSHIPGDKWLKQGHTLYVVRHCLPDISNFHHLREGRD